MLRFVIDGCLRLQLFLLKTTASLPVRSLAATVSLFGVFIRANACMRRMSTRPNVLAFL